MPQATERIPPLVFLLNQAPVSTDSRWARQPSQGDPGRGLQRFRSQRSEDAHARRKFSSSYTISLMFIVYLDDVKSDVYIYILADSPFQIPIPSDISHTVRSGSTFLSTKNLTDN